MGRPKMVQTMDSEYTYTEMQDTNVTHFSLWDGNINYRVCLVDTYGPKTRGIIDFALLSLYFKGVDFFTIEAASNVIAYFRIKILISTKGYKKYYLCSAEAIMQKPTQLYTIIHFFLIQHSEQKGSYR